MNEKQIKRFFEDKGMKIADVVRAMQEDFTSITDRSADMMLRQLIAGQRWYPVYAEWLRRKYGVVVDPPQPFKKVRERMRVAA